MSAKSRRVRPLAGPRQGTKATQAADCLREAILRGQHAVGQPLRELELCGVLGISRIPLREALHRLEAEGLVTIRPNRGAIVAGVSRSEVLEIGEVCRLLEAHVLRVALPALSVEILDRAEACLDLLDELDARGDPAEWSRANWRFHSELYQAAGRPLQLELLESLRARAERAMLILVADPKRRQHLNREHRAILTALRKGRGERAAELLDAHLRGGKEEAMRLLEEQ